jgi:hypothetical protein
MPLIIKQTIPREQWKDIDEPEGFVYYFAPQLMETKYKVDKSKAVEIGPITNADKTFTQEQYEKIVKLETEDIKRVIANYEQKIKVQKEILDLIQSPGFTSTPHKGYVILLYGEEYNL